MNAVELEAAIRAAQRRFAHATNKRDRHYAWLELSRLIGQRTPEQVERLERERGLHV